MAKRCTAGTTEHAQSEHRDACQLYSLLIAVVRMKGTEVPNPRRISTCDCTCVLTIDCLVTHACHAHSVLFLPMQSSFTNF